MPGRDGKGARGWLVWSGALLALLGFLFTATTPGLSMVAMAGPNIQVAGILGVYVCHTPGSPRAGLPGDDSSRSQSCCLICQVAQLAGGAVIPDAVAFPLPLEIRIHSEGNAVSGAQGTRVRHAQARAPPVV